MTPFEVTVAVSTNVAGLPSTPNATRLCAEAPALADLSTSPDAVRLAEAVKRKPAQHAIAGRATYSTLQLGAEAVGSVGRRAPPRAPRGRQGWVSDSVMVTDPSTSGG